MITVKMNNQENDHKELLAEMFPIIITVLGLIAVLVFYFFLD
jgi:hypothetical protein